MCFLVKLYENHYGGMRKKNKKIVKIDIIRNV